MIQLLVRQPHYRKVTKYTGEVAWARALGRFEDWEYGTVTIW
jgi:hypothetical protein